MHFDRRVKKRAGVAGAAFLIAALAVSPPASADADAAKLGSAYRAFLSHDYEKARKVAASIELARIENPEYALFALAQSSLMLSDARAALGYFRALAKVKDSRFDDRAKWGIADSLWGAGDHSGAASEYARLLSRAGKKFDAGLARFRVAEAAARSGRKRDAIKGFRSFRARHPLHPLEDRAVMRLRELGGAKAAELSYSQRIARAERMTKNKDWHQSIAELRSIPDSAGTKLVLMRDYWTGTTLFKMRRRYKDAGDILLGLYKRMGKRAAEALFRGARALSRADFDEDAITWYQRVISEYPKSSWAAEAQFLSGWLKFNMGKYRDGIPHLEEMAKKYRRSKFTRSADWYLGFSYYLLGEREKALPYFGKLAKRGKRLEGGKGRYWVARTKWLLGRKEEANAAYKKIIAIYPFSWYALLAHARLKRQGISVDPFGGRGGSGSVPAIAKNVPRTLASDPLIEKVDELLDAKLGSEASIELRRGERPFIRRHDRASAYALVLDRYRQAGNFNRPWMLSVVAGSRALRMKPSGRAKIWWQYAYPKAFEKWVEKYRTLGKAPKHYLHSIMRKESGFAPNTHSYANAIGLLQMIPATTRKVTQELGISYTADLLFDPELNIRTGAWYIGKLLEKFRGQIPFGAGSFNSGPRPVMRWLDKNSKRPTDEFVELVSYQQTREYMKKVTETYARYRYLYDEVVYEQPLEVNGDYIKDKLTY